jgi:hypothetical protein
MSKKHYSTLPNFNYIKEYNKLHELSVQTQFLNDNRGKAGVYMWVNQINGNTYVGSSVNLPPRFLKYFNEKALRNNNMLINLAIIKHGLDKFSLYILEYCSPENVLQREQHYLDLYKPNYNTLKTAGSSLGYVHTEDTLAKMSSRIVSEATLDKMRQRVQSKETREKIRVAIGIPVEVVDIHKEEKRIFFSKKEAGEFLGIADTTVTRYIKSGKLFSDRYLITEKKQGEFLYWQEGLSCKLNSNILLRVRISFLLILISSMVERNTSNILI